VILRILVFISGAVLMGLEILGSRILAPFYGNSIFVWGSLIGVFLGALSVGYWIGGRLADARPSILGMGVLLALAGALICVIPRITDMVAIIAGRGPRSGPLLAAVLLFSVPSILLGAISPYAIRISGTRPEQLGRTAGGLYAISTAGSIAGTIFTAFWLIPLAGVRVLTWTFGLTLMGLALLAALHLRNWRFGAAVIVGAIVGSSLAAPDFHLGSGQSGEAKYEAGPGGLARLKVIYQTDSLYHHIRVSEGGGRRYLRFDNSWQGGNFLSDPFRSTFEYPEYFHLIRALRPETRKVLVVGLGAGIAPKQFWRDYPSMQIDVVEIDPEVVHISYEFFALPKDSRIRVFAQDGRRYLERTSEKYDFIILDAFYSDSIPFHLTTREFMRVLKNHLTPDGMIAANLIGAFEGKKSTLFASYYQTVASEFPERYVFAEGYGSGARLKQSANLILFAGTKVTQSPDRFNERLGRIKGTGIKSFYAGHGYDLVPRAPDVRSGTMLTDDFAPVDNMLRFPE